MPSPLLESSAIWSVRWQEAVEQRLGYGKVFLDAWYEYYISGFEADLRLQNIYQKRTELVVSCISERYGNKQWTLAEFEAIRALKMQLSGSEAERDSLRILPLRVGEGDVRGIFVNVICPDIRVGPRGFRDDLMSSVRFRRVLRRGREYGSELTPANGLAPTPLEDPGGGPHFICFNANISRQFEFLQNAWIRNTKFSG